MSAYDLSALASAEGRHSPETPREMLSAAVEQLSTAQALFGLAQSLEAIREAERLIREADLLLARRYRPIEVRRGGSHPGIIVFRRRSLWERLRRRFQRVETSVGRQRVATGRIGWGSEVWRNG